MNAWTEFLFIIKIFISIKRFPQDWDINAYPYDHKLIITNKLNDITLTKNVNLLSIGITSNNHNTVDIEGNLCKRIFNLIITRMSKQKEKHERAMHRTKVFSILNEKLDETLTNKGRFVVKL